MRLKQYREYPGGSSKNLINAVSCIYDIELTRPVVFSREDTTPTWYFDR
jgi:hypothetical protein